MRRIGSKSSHSEGFLESPSSLRRGEDEVSTNLEAAATPQVETQSSSSPSPEIQFSLLTPVVYFYTWDHLGTVRLITNSYCQIVSKHDYEPYGVEIPPFYDSATATDFPSANTHKFTGQERDQNTNYDYMHFRYYSSNIGRFLKPDNVTGSPMNPQNWNLYSYVRGNPVNFNDPTGHQGEETNAKLPQSGGDPNAQVEAKEQIKEEQNANQETEENKPPEGANDQGRETIAVLMTDMTNGQTTLRINNPSEGVNYIEYTIPTSNQVIKVAEEGSQNAFLSVDVYQKTSIRDVAYGPEGAYIEVGNQYDIHGGGTALGEHAFDPNQELKPTEGCTRGHNADVISLGGLITNFKQRNPGEVVNYVRYGTPAGATKQTRTIAPDAPIIQMMREGILRLFQP